MRRLDAAALGRQGARAGALVAVVPAVAGGAAAAWLVHSLRGTLETWRNVRVPLPAPLPAAPVVDFVALLNLEPALDFVRRWDNPALVVVVVLLGAVAAGALIGAAIGLLIAALYNAGAAGGNGLVIDLEPLECDDLDEPYRRREA